MSVVTLSPANVICAFAVACWIIGLLWRIIRLLESLLSHVTGQNAKPAAILFRRHATDVTPAVREYH